MGHVRAFVFLVVMLSISSVEAQALPPPVDLPVQNLPQETPVWCWAAVSQQIILHSVGPARTPAQCALVAMANNASPMECCGFANPQCVRTGSLEQIQRLLLSFGGRFSQQAPPADPMVLYWTLASGRPIILHVRSGQMSSHVVVLRGMSFHRAPGAIIPVLHINDPMSYFTQPVPFARLMPLWISAIVVDPGLMNAQPGPRDGASDSSETSDDQERRSQARRSWRYQYRRVGTRDWRSSIRYSSEDSCEQAQQRKEESPNFVTKECEGTSDE